MRRLERALLSTCCLCAALALATSATAQSRTGERPAGQYILIANDQKTFFEKDGPRNAGPGQDSVTVLDVSKPLQPRIVVNLPLMSSVFGPPTNLAITPDGTVGLVANPVVMTREGEVWKPSPDDKVHVIDLTASPPKHVESITVGKQPSGMAINKKGDLALVANRSSKSISVLTIASSKVQQVAEVPVGDEAASVAITPDGKRALIAKNAAHKIGVLAIDGPKVTYDRALDMVVGYGVYTVEITPGGRFGMAANTGIGGDGHADTVSVIDVRAEPPRVIDHLTVGDGPEGFAISPNGVWAVAVLLKGSAAKPTSWSYTKTGSLRLIRLDASGKMRVLNEVAAGALPEGIAFSADSRYVFVGNYIDKNVQVFEIKNGQIVDTGVKVALPGQPAAIRGRM